MYEQLNIFDLTRKTFHIDKPIRLIELFAGIGSQAMALRDIEADFEHYRVIEFDKYAVASYNAIHGTDFETADIRNISGEDLGICNTDKYCYIMTYSFPCQDLSVAGNQKGMAKGSGTRSGLLWEVERLLNECDELPQVLLMENVPQVHSDANMTDFQKWIGALERKGYANYWQDLNAKDYGVPQNRNRCFMVSLLGEWNFKFPKPIPIERKLKDYLEDEVDEKYYINTEKAQKLIQTLIENGTLKEGTGYANYNHFEQYSDVAKCIQARDYKGFGGSVQTQNAVVEKVGNGVVEMRREVVGSIYSNMTNEFQTGISPIARCVKAENHDLSVVEMEERRLGNIYGFGGGNYAGNVYDDEMLSPTIRTYQGGNQQPIIIERSESERYRLRKLTPLECWRLMGFLDEDFRKAEEVNSNSQLYKQAGNSIVKNVLMAIFGKLMEIEGVQGIESQQALTAYIEGLKDEDLKRMCAADKEAALQIFTDCFGAARTAEKYSEWENEDIKRVNEILRRELMLARCKADLYDFYTEQGEIPKNEADRRKEKKGK